MFNLSTEYELQYRLAEIERTHAAGWMKAQALRQMRAEGVGRGLPARIASAVPLQVSVRVRWQPNRGRAGTSCETAT